MTTDNTTLAFIAIGAADAFLKHAPQSGAFGFDSYLDFIEHVIAFEPNITRVCNYYSETGDHPGVWDYEISEEFGAVYARRVLIESDGSTPQQIMREQLQAGQWPNIDEAMTRWEA